MRMRFAIGVFIFLLLGGLSDPDGTKSEPAPSAPVTASNGDDALERRVAEIDSRIAQIKTLKADFEQTKTTPLLKKPLLSTGTIAVKGLRAKWTTQSPRRSAMTFGAGEIRMFYPQERVVEIYTMPERFRELSGNPLGQFGAMRSMFRISQIDSATLETPPLSSTESQYLALELSPIGSELQEHVSKIRVLIDCNIPCVTRLDVFDGDGACTTIKLANIQANIDVPDEDVETVVPDGTRESRPFPSRSDKKPAGEEKGDEHKGTGK